MLDRIDNGRAYLSTAESNIMVKAIKQHGSSGRPAKSDLFIEKLEYITGQSLKKKKPGSKVSS